MSFTAPKDLIPEVTAYVQTYMSHFDASHDFAHITRVLGLAHSIHASLTTPSSPHFAPSSPPLDLDLIALASLLHDIGDRKYLSPHEDASTLISNKLLELGASPALAAKVQKLCTNVSWTNELQNPEKVQELIDGEMPELAVVQDADRLDALGAVGVGRCFTFAGARGGGRMRGLQGLGERLWGVEGRMKTSVGKEMARTKTQRMRDFEKLWDEELKVEEVGVQALREAGVGADVLAIEVGGGGYEKTLGMEEQKRLWREELKGELRKEILAEMLPN